MRHRYLYTLLAILMIVTTQVSAQSTTFSTTKKSKSIDEHMEWWREAKFGMFIHWGLYAIPARGEWVMNREKIPVAEYAKLATQFNPVKFNAGEWVRVAKDAGMKYIVITAKHHDGFAMYGSKVSSYNIVDATPFKRDPMKELSEACAREGIKLGFYYSQAQDWHQPGGAVAKGKWDSIQNGDFETYLHTIAIPQVKELLSRYNPAVIWFDTPVNMTPAYAREVLLAVRSISPKVVVNSRILYSGAKTDGLGQAQLDELREIGTDYLTYRDRQIPTNPVWRDWETCMTLNGAWGFNANDHNWKSPQTVVQMLVRVVHNDGNFLLNFGPTAEGILPAEGVAVVKQVGQWLRVNGEAIYGVRASKLGMVKEFPAVKNGTREVIPEPEIDWLATERPALNDQAAKIYLHIFKWPNGKFEVKGISSKVSKVYLLANPTAKLKFEQNNETVDIRLPGKPVDDVATVVCLEMN
jgi:alpha-L-fucosidase